MITFKDIHRFISDFSLPPFLLTVTRHAKPIFILGFLPSALAFSFFPRHAFFDFLKHHLVYINNWPYFFISLFIYLIGLGYSSYFKKYRIESEFKAIFQSIIGILLFLFICCFFFVFYYLSIEFKQSLYFFYLTILIFMICASLFIFLRIFDKLEIALHNRKANHLFQRTAKSRGRYRAR